MILPSLSGAPEDPDFDLPAQSELAHRRGAWAERRRHHALRRARPLFRLPNGSLPRILLDSVQEGSTWRVWRPTDPAWPAPADSGEVTTCYPGTLQFRSSAAAQPMCLAKHDIVSDGIRRFSRWRDCSRLLRLWQAAARDANGVRGGVAFDLGANIGACTVELLMRTHAHVVAFEPSPINLFYMTRSLKMLPKELAQRVVVYPIALGDGGPPAPANSGPDAAARVAEGVPAFPNKEAGHTDPLAFPLVALFVERGNQGNTVVGAAATADGGCWSHVNVRGGFDEVVADATSSLSTPGSLAAAGRAAACAARMRRLTSLVPSARLDDLFPNGLGATRLVKLVTSHAHRTRRKEPRQQLTPVTSRLHTPCRTCRAWSVVCSRALGLPSPYPPRYEPLWRKHPLGSSPRIAAAVAGCCT